MDDLLNITVSVESRAEDSYNSRVILKYPTDLSFRRFTRLQGRVECTSVDSLEDNKVGHTDCTIDKPIFRSQAKAFFIVSYGILSSGISKLNKNILITANATSGNDAHSPESELFKKKEIDVKYSVFVTISRSLIYTNFSAGKNSLEKPVEHPVRVLNLLRQFNLTVIFQVPIKLGDKDIWVNASRFQIPGCRRDKDVEPTVKGFVDKLKKNATVDCSVARCGVFLCDTSMRKDDSNLYNISGNLSSGWIEQIGLVSAKFLLVSTVTLDYDRNQYIFFSTESQSNPPIQRIETEVEVYPEVDLTKEIVGGTMGGLVLLALITAGLYKAGFFKSQYKQMLENEAGGEQGPPDSEAAALDQQ
ncbi:integrin alpha-M-like [Aplochiton taeniatus]